MEKDNPPGNQTNVSQTDTTNSIAAGHIEKVVIAPQPDGGFDGIRVSPEATNVLMHDNVSRDNWGNGYWIGGTNVTFFNNLAERNGARRPPEKRTVIHMATKPPKPEPGI
jgi:hypothetical protein